MVSAKEKYENEGAVLDHYQKEVRPITPAFIDGIPWDYVNEDPLSDELIIVLQYMAAIEASTQGHYEAWLKGTPSNRDPIISPFIKRWTDEETTHGELLREFLGKIGHPMEEEPWKDSTTVCGIRINTRTIIANLFPQSFMMTHMVTGGIHERATSLAYQLVAERTKNPVLKYILDGLIREEARHMRFYEAIAELRLTSASSRERKLIRLAVENTMHPVGTGIGKSVKTEEEASHMLKILLGEKADIIKTRVDDKVARLPGFEGFSGLSDIMQQYLDRTA